MKSLQKLSLNLKRLQVQVLSNHHYLICSRPHSSFFLVSTRQFASQNHKPSLTLHEESAGGLNGRLAQYAHSLSSSSSADLLDFYYQLGPSARSQLNLSSFNYVLEALLHDGKQMEAFKLISDLEGGNHVLHNCGFPDRTSFLVLMQGLVEADSSGSLALAINEIFELMHRKYQFEPDLPAWSLRIRAFLHPKFIVQQPTTYKSKNTDPVNTDKEPSRVFYHEMLNFFKDKVNAPNFNIELNNLRAELIVTAVNRRLWSFAEWMLNELTVSSSASSNSFEIWDKIVTSTGLFNDSASIPILRHLQASLVKGKQTSSSSSSSSLSSSRYYSPSSTASSSSSISTSIGFNIHLLFFCWRQGRLTSDLALSALKFLMQSSPEQANIWLDTAEGCLGREWPKDLDVYDSDCYDDNVNSEIRERILTTILRSKCPNSSASIKELEREIRNYKLLL